MGNRLLKNPVSIGLILLSKEFAEIVGCNSIVFVANAEFLSSQDSVASLIVRVWIIIIPCNLSFLKEGTI